MMDSTVLESQLRAWLSVLGCVVSVYHQALWLATRVASTIHLTAITQVSLHWQATPDKDWETLLEDSFTAGGNWCIQIREKTMEFLLVLPTPSTYRQLN